MHGLAFKQFRFCEQQNSFTLGAEFRQQPYGTVTFPPERQENVGKFARVEMYIFFDHGARPPRLDFALKLT
jgi:hypothetical protein